MFLQENLVKIQMYLIAPISFLTTLCFGHAQTENLYIYKVEHKKHTKSIQYCNCQESRSILFKEGQKT